MLLVDYAALCLQHKNYDWQAITYPVIKQDTKQYFISLDSCYHAHTQLAQCKHTGNVHGYIAAFMRLALNVPNLSEAEKLDRFLHGFKPAVFKWVILQNQCSF